MTTETKVEAAAWAIVADGYMVDYADTTKQRCENVAREYGEGAKISIEPLYPQSALDALRGEVADRDAVIECKNIDIRERDRSLHEWAERAKAAERRVAELEAAISGVVLAFEQLGEAKGIVAERSARRSCETTMAVMKNALTKESP